MYFSVFLSVMSMRLKSSRCDRFGQLRIVHELLRFVQHGDRAFRILFAQLAGFGLALADFGRKLAGQRLLVFVGRVDQRCFVALEPEGGVAIGGFGQRRGVGTAARSSRPVLRRRLSCQRLRQILQTEERSH